ncbi:MAG: sensor histidine kinase [Lachnospiraceae bacterium]|jgi:two-component system sensor histidine kinase YesM|nr:sensor histidine kinase [Lachnospiraceae bacterium]MEE3461438.1 sensor histidine kinase [Lachnospiraceae bacterium]
MFRKMYFKIRTAFKNMRLTSKVIVIYLLIGALPMLVLGFMSIFLERQVLYHQNLESLKSSVITASEQLDSKLLVYNNLSDYIAYSQPVTDVLTASYSTKYEFYEQYKKTVDPILSSPQYFSPDITQLTIYVDRDMPAHGYSIAPMSDLARESWFDKVKDDLQPQVSWTISLKEKTVRSVRTMPLMAQNGENAVLLLKIQYDSIFSDFEKLLKKGCALYIVDAQGKVLYEKSRLEGNVKPLAAAEALKLSKGKERSSEYFALNHKVSSSDWQVVLYGKQRLLAGNNIILIMMVVFFAIIIGFLLFVANRFFDAYVIRDVHKLERNMNTVAQGDRTLRVVSDSRDEIGSLIRGFGSMLTEINQLIRENYESKLALRMAEMKALQAQINPHFLYNSLSLINWKAIEAGADDISSITLALSSFYRTSLNHGRNVLTVEKELENVRSYIKIQEYMHDFSFDTEFDVDKDIYPYEMLNLLLQPLIENAIDHGIDLKEDGRGCIRVKGCQAGDTIQLTVEDNGVGMDEKTQSTILTYKSHGYGVQNINQRIQLFYGEPYSLKIESKPGEGTRCIVTIPKRLPE